MTKALLIVDTTPTFCEGGGLGVTGGNELAEKIANYVVTHADDYSYIVASEDWHIDPGEHWSEEPNYQTSFPRHGVAGTDEARIHPVLQKALNRVSWTLVRKGMRSASFSMFDGVVVQNDHEALEPVGPDFGPWLLAAGVTEVDIVGIATEFCDKMTALDARIIFGLKVNFLYDLTVAVDPSRIENVREELDDADIEWRASV